MAALGGGRDGRQLCSVLCNLEDACYSQRAEQSRAGPLCAGPGSLITPHFLSLRGSQANLLARDLILVLAALCSPPCVIMLHKSEKHARRRRRMMEWDWGELSLALLCMYFVFSLCLKCFGTMCLPVKNVTFSAVDRRALQLWFWAKAGPKPGQDEHCFGSQWLCGSGLWHYLRYEVISGGWGEWMCEGGSGKGELKPLVWRIKKMEISGDICP